MFWLLLFLRSSGQRTNPYREVDHHDPALLINFAGKYPILQGKQRQVIEAIHMAMRAKNANYEITRREYKVDENTGQPVKRVAPLAG
jgi:hypothetical protein